MFRPTRSAFQSVVNSVSSNKSCSWEVATATVVRPVVLSCCHETSQRRRFLTQLSNSNGRLSMLLQQQQRQQRQQQQQVLSSAITDNGGLHWFSSNNTKTSNNNNNNNNKEEEEEDDDHHNHNKDTKTTVEKKTEEEEEEEGSVVDDTHNLTKLQQELQTIKDQLLRSLAEQENIRHIARNDVQAAKQFSIKKFAKSLLDVVDNLDRAIESVGHGDDDDDDDDKINNNNAVQTDSNANTFDTFYQGIIMTQQGLIKALESNGVSVYCDKPGDKFNPEIHEALMEYSDPTGSPGTVGQVIKKGYMLNGRVLRPAEVGVIKK